MTKARSIPFLFKHFFLLALCVCLMAGLFSQPVKSTAAYVISLSVTCVNTFTGDGQIKPTDPSDPSKPSEPAEPTQNPDTPPTGETGYVEWYAIGMLLSLAGLVATWKWERKRDSAGVYDSEV